VHNVMGSASVQRTAVAALLGDGDRTGWLSTVHNVMGTASVLRTAVAALLGDGDRTGVAEHSA